jgi:transcription initiation factor TFIID subunit 10
MTSSAPTENHTEPVAAVQPNGTQDDAPQPPLVDPRVPTRKDVSLKDFLSKMDDYAPIVRLLHRNAFLSSHRADIIPPYRSPTP